MTKKLILKKSFNHIKLCFVNFVIDAQNAINIFLEFVTRSKSIDNTVAGDFQTLIVRTQAVGDFLMALPAIKMISEAFPNSKNLLLALGSTASANATKVTQYLNGQFIWRDLIPNSIIDCCIVCLPSVQTILGLRQKLRPIVKNISRCYLVGENISLGFGITKKILMLRLIGFRGQIYGIRIRACIQIFPKLQIADHKIEHHVLTMIRTVSECPIVAKSTAENPEIILTLLQKNGNLDRFSIENKINLNNRYAVISPGSILEFKRWPTENFIKVAQYILNEYQIPILIVGSISEKNVCKMLFEALMQNSANQHIVHNICGKTTVSQLASILEKSILLVANDGGACHLAAAVGCPVISISNGAEPQNSVEPWGFQHLTARFLTDCSPCYCFTHCPNGSKACVNKIPIESVLLKIDSILNRNRSN